MQNLLKYQGLTLLWALFILFICCASLGSAGDSPLFFKGFDKITHTGLFFVLTVLTFFGLIRKQSHNRLSALVVIIVFVLMFLFGGAIEILQWKVFTYRSAELADLFCDMLGTAMAMFSVLVITNAIRQTK